MKYAVLTCSAPDKGTVRVQHSDNSVETVVEYSTAFERIEIVVGIDHSMKKKNFIDTYSIPGKLILYVLVPDAHIEVNLSAFIPSEELTT